MYLLINFMISNYSSYFSLTRPRSISFADEHGEELVENTYSKQLYYGTSGTAIRRTSDSGSCCVLS